MIECLGNGLLFLSVLIPQCATAQTVAGTSALRVIAAFLVSYNLHCFL